MQTLRAIVVYMAVTAMLFKYAVGADHTVGAPSGSWDLNTNLTAWTASQKFSVGDNLIFQYTQLHSVFQVSKADYDACLTDTPILSFTGGKTTILLSTAVKIYFICGTGGHCGQGMKVEIDTLAASTTPPPSPPSTTPTPPPPSPLSTTPTPPPPSPPSTTPTPPPPSTPSTTPTPPTPSPPPSTNPPPTAPSTPSTPPVKPPPPSVPTPLPPSTPPPANSPKTSPTSPSTSMQPSESPSGMGIPPVALSPAATAASKNNGLSQVKPAMGLGFGIMMLLAL